ncbi:hypothetical protein WMC41_29550 (plasmid) [Shinella yambaruensis]|uniref:hypothetical protein n=1 Tax=Shinella yambaruensis TaxID=415996 RepID=UPI003D7AA2D6
MFSEIVGSVVAAIVVEPLQAEINEKIEQARLPVSVIQQSKACIAMQGPKLLERATNDWGWAAATVVSVSIGFTAPLDMLDANDPQCASLIQTLEGADGDA